MVEQPDGWCVRGPDGSWLAWSFGGSRENSEHNYLASGENTTQHDLDSGWYRCEPVLLVGMRAAGLHD